MKTVIIDSLKQLVANRYLLVLSSGLLALAIGAVIYIALTVHPSELQLVSHYTAYGVTHLYRDQWFYLLTFAVFPLFVAIFHIILGIKLLLLKGPSLAIAFVWMGVAIIIIGWITASALLNVWSPL